MNRLLQALAFVALAASTTACTATTETAEVGVRVSKKPFFGGIVEEVYPAGGTHFFTRAVNDWYVFSTALQNLVMVREDKEGQRRGDDSLRFKTIDGNDVSVNVTIAWKIVDVKAPYILKNVGASTDEVREKLVRPVSRTLVRDVLNRLTSEEYYQANKRFEMAEIARQLLNERFEEEGVFVQQILLGEHKFNDTYEKTIRDKKVAEQEAERLESETEATEQEMLRDLEKAKGVVGKAIEAAKGEATRKQLEADAIYFERQQQAEAILAEKSAKAEGLTKQARALAGSGGTKMVKLAIARALKGKEILFIPAGEGMDVRTTDMNTLLKSYGINQASKTKAK